MNLLKDQKFGKWTIIEQVPVSRNCNKYYLCQCECKSEKFIELYNLIRGKTTQCLECAQKNRSSHGLSKHPIYSVYIQMKERCLNPCHKYFSWYGGRGIQVCERWKESFENFLQDMGKGKKGLSLDRINNDGPYSKENCRWVTKKTQQNNRRNSILIGEISPFKWKIVKDLGDKKYGIECIKCSFNTSIWGCNFRRKKEHECEIE